MTTYLGKSCSFGLPRVPFVNYRQFMYLVISLLVLRAGCGIWLYQFLIIAYLFTLFRFVVHSEARTRLDNLTKIKSSNAWISSWNAQMLHFPLCRESALRMPRIETELSSIWSPVLAYVWHCMLFYYYHFFFTRIYLQHIARPVESDRPINIVFVRPSILSSVVSLWM